MVSLNRQENTKLKTASAVVQPHSAVVVSVDLIGGSDASTLTLYDDPTTNTAGTEILKLACVANDSKHFVGNVVAKTGLYAALTGTASAYIIRFD